MPTGGEGFEAQLFWGFWSFVLLLGGTIVITLVTTFVKRKVFGVDQKTAALNGELKAAMAPLIKVLTDNGKTLGKMHDEQTKAFVGQAKMVEVLTAKGKDQVPLVWNKESIEEKIDETHADVKRLLGRRNGSG